jgi:amidase
MINLDEYSALDAVDLVNLVKKGDVTAKELAAAALRGVDSVNPTLNAIIETYPDRVDQLDEEALRHAPLGGVPFFLKDLGPTEVGKKSEWGSAFTQGIVADSTTYLTDQFYRAGLCNLGRTTCPEFGFTISTESVVNGITRNPWDTTKSPGGSSGGSAALVASGVVPIAHTNDGAGSTRIPASMCGLVGLKCSRGTISLGPGAGDVQFPLYSEFVVSRTVRDTKAVLKAINGPMPGESIYAQLRPPSKERGRIAISSGNWGPHSSTPYIQSEVVKVGDTLQELGYAVDYADPGINFDEFHDVTHSFFSIMAMIEIDTMSRVLGKEVRPDEFETMSYRIYCHGKTFGIQDYIGLLDKMNQYARILGDFYETYDFLTTPTLAKPIPEANTLSLNRDLTVEEYYRQMGAQSPYVSLNNFTGTPAISLPLATHEDSTPLGIMFHTAIGGEFDLIKVAGELEEALPWKDRRPMIHVANEGNEIFAGQLKTDRG